MIRHTTILHEIRIEHGLSWMDYGLCETVNFYCSLLSSKVPGWCYMSRDNMAEFIGVTKPTLLTMIAKMEQKGFIERNEQSKYLRSTEKWQSLLEMVGKKILPPVKKLDDEGKKILPGEGKEILPKYYYNTDNSNNTNTAPSASGVSGSAKAKSVVFVVPELEEVKNYFIKLMGDSKRQNPWPEDKCIFQANVMYDHYQANGWVQGRGKKIQDWKAAARNFIRNNMQGIFSASFTPTVKQENKPVQNKPHTPVQQPIKNKIANDVEYLYERYLENSEHVSILSIEPLYYDYLQKNKLISITPAEVERVKDKAKKERPDAAGNEHILKPLCQKFVVLLMFEKFKGQGKEKILL